MRLLRHQRENPETELDRSLEPAYGGSDSDRGGRVAGSGWGVRLAHSTLSTGKPCTWGRGQQSDVVCKGNFTRTCWVGP
jgi:hypothetical protein